MNLPLAERIESIADAMSEEEDAQTAAQLADETGFRTSSTMAALLWMERRGQVSRSGVAASGAITWRLARG
jgi:predicted Rossmann fold nucleotide-binding protein DprA/Smf involved in DNA uptake